MNTKGNLKRGKVLSEERAPVWIENYPTWGREERHCRAQGGERAWLLNSKNGSD